MKTFKECCLDIIENSAVPALNYAVPYAQTGMLIRSDKGARVQALYILNNMQQWRGPLAKEVREALKHHSKEKKL